MAGYGGKFLFDKADEVVHVVALPTSPVYCVPALCEGVRGTLPSGLPCVNLAALTPRVFILSWPPSLRNLRAYVLVGAGGKGGPKASSSAAGYGGGYKGDGGGRGGRGGL